MIYLQIVLLLAWLLTYFFIIFRENKDLLGRKLSLGDLFSRLGFFFYKRFNLEMDQPFLYKKFRPYQILYGDRLALGYFQKDLSVALGQSFFLLGLVILCLNLSPFLSFLLILLIFLRLYYPFYDHKKKAEEIQREIISQLPKALMKLNLALQSGLILETAWKQVAGSSQGVFYDCMEEVMESQKAGKGLIQSYREFGDQYRLRVLKDIGAVIAKNMENGGAEIVRALEQIQKTSYSQLKSSYRISSELAQQKMIFPSLLLFIGILLLILLPAFGQVSF